MPSTQILASAIISGIVFLIDGAVMFLILSRGRQKYHYLFAAVMAAFAIGNLAMFLFDIRNSYPDELIIYFAVTQASAPLSVPCIYHFTCLYLNQPMKRSTIFIWAYTVIIVIFNLFGVVTGTSPMALVHADWGNYIAHSSDAETLIVLSIMFVILLIFIWSACWFLLRARRRETSQLAQRHMQYILISFLLISFLFLTIFLFPTKFEGSLLTHPIRGLLMAAFGSLIGIAIIKERLFDITVIIKKTTIYSILLALVIFIFSLSEHLLATYVMEFFGGHSIFIHLISIAVVIAILMPIRQKVERAIERLFAQKKVEF
jgi:hypothetical protein